MVRTRTGELLDDWLCRVKASRIRERPRFVAGVIQDKAAVVAGLTLPQNNGLGDRQSEQTETDQKDGVWPCRISLTPKAGSPCALKGAV